MDEENVSPEWLRGYNDGYALQKKSPDVADEYLKRRKEKLHAENKPAQQGMADGIMQARIEAMKNDLDETLENKKKRGFKQ